MSTDDAQPANQSFELTDEECVVYLTEVRGGEWEVAVEHLRPRASASSVSTHHDYASGFAAARTLAARMRCQLLIQRLSGGVDVIAAPNSEAST